MADRTGFTRKRNKASDERAVLDALLDSTRVGHFALTASDGHPMVVPTAIARDGDRVIAHGSTGSSWMRRLAEGAPTCLAVTALDALLVSRSAFESSMHYRSAVLFRSCTAITDEPEKRRTLDAVTDHLIPGRVAELRAPTDHELAATLVLALPIAEWSLKVSTPWPDDPPEDVAGDAWAGVVPLETGFGAPRPAPDLRDGIPVPPSVRGLR